MADLSTLVEFVKNQAEFHRGMISKHEGNERRQQRHIETAERFDELEAYLTTTTDAHANAGAATRLSLSWDEVEELPAELLAELSVSDGDKTEFQILSAIEKVGGVASLDRIIVELWKATGEVHKRPAVTNRLYRMGGKELLYSVPGKKGVYSLSPLTDEEAEALR